MARKPKKPPVVQEDLDDESYRPPEEATLKDHVTEIHGQMDQPQAEMPTREWLQEQFTTKSAAIRYLISRGFTVKEISKHLGIRYQMVRNIATNQLKRGPNEDWRKPYLAGQTIPDIKDPKPVKS